MPGLGAFLWNLGTFLALGAAVQTNGWLLGRTLKSRHPEILGEADSSCHQPSAFSSHVRFTRPYFFNRTVWRVGGPRVKALLVVQLILHIAILAFVLGFFGHNSR